MIRVLIVDDEFIMRQGLRYMMDWEQEGYEIVGEAANGKDALRLIEELEPHIIISDVVMPLLDGVDFSEEVSSKTHTESEGIEGGLKKGDGTDSRIPHQTEHRKRQLCENDGTLSPWDGQGTGFCTVSSYFVCVLFLSVCGQRK